VTRNDAQRKRAAGPVRFRPYAGRIDRRNPIRSRSSSHPPPSKSCWRASRHYPGSCAIQRAAFPLARFGPTTPKRATTSLAASVDPTEARCARLNGVVCVRPPAYQAAPNAGWPSYAGVGTDRAAGIAPVTLFTLHIGQNSVTPCRLGMQRKCVGRTSVPRPGGSMASRDSGSGKRSRSWCRAVAKLSV
jgi:hypothetical protein